MQSAGQFYISTRNKQFMATEDGSTKMPLFTIYKSTPLVDAMAKMVATRSHRLWIIEDGPSSSPAIIGLVSLSSVMRCIE